MGSARTIFTAPQQLLQKVEGIGETRAAAIKAFRDFDTAAKEIEFIQQYHIQPIFITDEAYPKRLLNCYDSPTLLYYKGQANLNESKIIAIVGTRTNSEYGRLITEQLLAGLAGSEILVISGLAHGIDAIAHRAALKNGLPTIGVLAHGLSQVYPNQHTSLAREMIHQGGGLLTEFRSPAEPDRHQFPARNRIVAGMSDATIVIETGVKGGSMITAELANGYNRDVFAIPGRANDAKSAGSNYLIRHHKALLINNADELLESLDWKPRQVQSPKPQKQLFIELTADERIVVELLKGRESMHIDEINLRSGLSNSSVAAAILNMEMQNVIFARPGRYYSLQ